MEVPLLASFDDKGLPDDYVGDRYIRSASSINIFKSRQLIRSYSKYELHIE